MELSPVYPVSILKKCREFYRQEGTPTGWTGPTEKAPYHSLLVYLNEVGKRDSSLVLELCFLPNVEEGPYQGIYLLQAFISIREDVQPSFYRELFKVIASVNTQLPLGSFGLFRDTGVLYFKYNSVIDKSIDEQSLVRLIDRQNDIILHQLFVFLDMLLDVADGLKTNDDAMRNAPLL